ncbi:hypothetical protein ACX9R5_12910 [Rathayibacter sp. CAU 1779]
MTDQDGQNAAPAPENGALQSPTPAAEAASLPTIADPPAVPVAGDAQALPASGAASSTAPEAHQAAASVNGAQEADAQVPASASPQAGQEYPTQPAEAPALYPAQPGQAQQYPASGSTQQHPPQPGQAQPYPVQPGQAQQYPAQAGQTQPYPGQPGQPAQTGQPYPPGPPYPQQGQPTPYGIQPPARPRKGVRAWVWWLIGGVGAFIVLGVAAVVLIVVLAANSGARPVAQQYVDAIAHGDAKTADRLARVTPSTKNDELLTDAVLSKATKRITHVQVTKTVSSRSSDLTYASVAFQLDGKSYHDTIELDKDANGWFVREGLTYHLPALSDSSVSSDAGYALKGGDVAVTSDTYDLVAYPGVYTLSAPNEYYTLSSSTDITVAPDAATSISGVKLTPSQKYIDAVQQQVNAHFDKCAALTDYYDIEDCGIELGYTQNVMSSGSSVAVKVTAYPKVVVDDSDSYNQFKLDGGSFTATITGETYDGGQGSESIDAGAGYTSADITIKDGKVTVTFD